LTKPLFLADSGLCLLLLFGLVLEFIASAFNFQIEHPHTSDSFSCSRHGTEGKGEGERGGNPTALKGFETVKWFMPAC